MIKVGQNVKFNQFKHGAQTGTADIPSMVTGKVIYVNKQHRYFTVEYECGGTWKMSFKFDELVGVGEDGHVRIVKG